MSNNLNFFEKLHLRWRARRDVRMDLFRDYAVEDPVTGQADHFVISNFITYEVGCYEQKRTHMHTGKRYLFWTPLVKQRLRRYRLQSLKNTMAELNSAVSSVQAQIHLAYAEYNKTMDILSEQTDQYTEDNAPHYVRACYNKSVEARTRFQKTTKRLYSRAIELLNQKIRILTRLSTHVDGTRARYFQRIRFYYERASALEPKLPVQYLGDDRLGMIGAMSTINPARIQELYDTQALLDAMTREIDALFP